MHISLNTVGGNLPAKNWIAYVCFTAVIYITIKSVTLNFNEETEQEQRSSQKEKCLWSNLVLSVYHHHPAALGLVEVPPPHHSSILNNYRTNIVRVVKYNVWNILDSIKKSFIVPSYNGILTNWHKFNNVPN